MVSIAIRKSDGKEAGALDLSDAVFATEPNLHCVRDTVTQFLANQRLGTHKTRTRGEVSGGGRKPWKQKGTGRARQGSIRSPQWRGGAIIFGPRPRDYSFRINRKVRQAAYRSVFSELMGAGRLIAVESFELDKPRTATMVEVFGQLGIDGPVLLVVDQPTDALALSVRNIPWVTLTSTDNLNVYDLLTHDWVVATADALKRVEERYA